MDMTRLARSSAAGPPLVNWSGLQVLKTAAVDFSGLLQELFVQSPGGTADLAPPKSAEKSSDKPVDSNDSDKDSAGIEEEDREVGDAGSYQAPAARAKESDQRAVDEPIGGRASNEARQSAEVTAGGQDALADGLSEAADQPRGEDSAQTNIRRPSTQIFEALANLDEGASAADSPKQALEVPAGFYVKIQGIEVNNNSQNAQNAQSGGDARGSVSIARIAQTGGGKQPQRQNHPSMMFERFAKFNKAAEISKGSRLSLLAKDENGGPVRVNISANRNNVRVNIIASDRGTFEHLNTGQELLQSALAKEGIRLSNFSASMSDGRSAHSNGQGDGYGGAGSGDFGSMESNTIVSSRAHDGLVNVLV